MLTIKFRPTVPTPRLEIVWSSLIVALLAGCGGGEDTSSANPVAAALQVNTPAQISQESADDYNDNLNGLITGATLKRWKDDWLNERPAGITGKLVILQTTAGSAGAEYVASADPNVYTYAVSSAEWTQTRSNGVVTTVSMVPDGPSMDAFLKKYAIDPAKDMIVCAMGGGGYSNAMQQGRCWYMFRYWGTPGSHLALLNGVNQLQIDNGDMTAADFAASADTPPENGTASVRDLPQDNTALQATVEDMLDILPSHDGNVVNDGVFIWDARSLDQYSAGEESEAGGPVADYMTTFQNNGSRQGHPRGALQLNYVNMLTTGYAYKPKTELAAYLAGEVDGGGKGFVDATYQSVGVGNAYRSGDVVYTYCETTFRAMITGMVSAVILGKPTRFYDGAMTEWNSLSYIDAWDGNPILPIDSPWRTDVVSFYKPASSPTLVSPRQVDDAYAASADAIIYADRVYKLFGSSGGGSDGGGVSLPSNPCGG